MRERAYKPYLLVVLATFLWGTNVVLGRWAQDYVGPFTLTAARFAIAGVLFGAANLLWKPQLSNGRGPRQALRGNWITLVGMGITGIFAFPAVMYLSLRWTTAANVSLINGITPLVTAILAAVLLKEVMGGWGIAGTIVSLVGVAFIIAGGSLNQLLQMRFNLGDLLAVMDVLLWAVYSILGRLATRNMTALQATTISTWIGLPFLILAAILEWNNGMKPEGWLWIPAVIYIGFFPSFLGFLAWNEGVRQLGPGQAMVFYNLFSVFGVVLGVIFLKENLLINHIVGGFLVIAGGLMGFARTRIGVNREQHNELET